MNVNEPPVLKRGQRIWHTFAILNCLNYHGSPIIPLACANQPCHLNLHCLSIVWDGQVPVIAMFMYPLCHINFSSWKVKQHPRPLTFEATTRLGRKTHCAMFERKKLGESGRSDLIIRHRLERCCHVWWVSFVCTKGWCLERLVFPCVPNMFHCEWNIRRKMIHFGIREKFWNQPDTVPLLAIPRWLFRKLINFEYPQLRGQSEFAWSPVGPRCHLWVYQWLARWTCFAAEVAHGRLGNLRATWSRTRDNKTWQDI